MVITIVKKILSSPKWRWCCLRMSVFWNRSKKTPNAIYKRFLEEWCEKYGTCSFQIKSIYLEEVKSVHLLLSIVFRVLLVFQVEMLTKIFFQFVPIVFKKYMFSISITRTLYCTAIWSGTCPSRSTRQWMHAIVVGMNLDSPRKFIWVTTISLYKGHRKFTWCKTVNSICTIIVV